MRDLPRTTGPFVAFQLSGNLTEEEVRDWVTDAMKPCARARVRWFPSSEMEDAWLWLLEEDASVVDRVG